MEGITATEATILTAAENICREIGKRFGAAAYDAEAREAGYYGRAAQAYDAAAAALSNADIVHTVYIIRERETAPAEVTT